MIKLSLPLRAACSLVAFAVLPSCGGAGTTSAPTAAAPADQARALEDTLMAHHDRAMNQTEKLFELKAKLTAAKVPAVTTPVIAKMQAADQAMMNWMHHYQAPDSAAPASQRLTYLKEQQQQLCSPVELVNEGSKPAWSAACAGLSTRPLRHCTNCQRLVLRQHPPPPRSSRRAVCLFS